MVVTIHDIYTPYCNANDRILSELLIGAGIWKPKRVLVRVIFLIFWSNNEYNRTWSA